MEEEEMAAKVDSLRLKFKEQYAENIKNGVYHEKDLEKLDVEDGLCRRFLAHQKQSVDKASTMVDNSFKWRKEIGVNDLTEKSFPREFHDLGGIYFHNVDKNGNKILYFKVAKHKKDPDRIFQQKQFVAWWIDKHFQKSPDEPIVVLFDMQGAGIANMDLDIVRFQISCFATYYPAFLAYMLIYEMPWVLNAVWKLIKQLLSEEQQKFVIFAKKNDVDKYIGRDQLLVHMGGTDTYIYQYMPSEDSGIDVNGDVEEMAAIDTGAGGEPEEQAIASTSAVTTAAASSTTARKRGGTATRIKLDINLSRSPTPVTQRLLDVDDDRESFTTWMGEPLDNDVMFAERENYTSFDGGEGTEEDRLSTASTPPGTSNGRLPSSKTVPMPTTDDNDRPQFRGNILTICPATNFSFNVTDDTVETLDHLCLTNITDKPVAYKVKTTNPDNYRVRTSSGVIKAQSSTNVMVYLQPGITNVSRDKFLVMGLQVDDANIRGQALAKLWKTAKKEPATFCEHRLWCTFVQEEEEPKSDLDKVMDRLTSIQTQGSDTEDYTAQQRVLTDERNQYRKDYAAQQQVLTDERKQYRQDFAALQQSLTDARNQYKYTMTKYGQNQTSDKPAFKGEVVNNQIDLVLNRQDQLQSRLQRANTVLVFIAVGLFLVTLLIGIEFFTEMTGTGSTIGACTNLWNQ